MTKVPEAELPLHRFTIDDYHQIGDLGLLEGQRVELLKGQIVDMSPIKPKHAGVVAFLLHHLSRQLSEAYIVNAQNPIALSDQSEPEPDVSILRYRADFYKRSHPQPEDIHLLIEVADTSLEKDQKVKLPLYAAAGIPEVWIVNLPEQQLEQYTEPAADGYRSIRIYRAGDTLEQDWIGVLEMGRLFGAS